MQRSAMLPEMYLLILSGQVAGNSDLSLASICRSGFSLLDLHHRAIHHSLLTCNTKHTQKIISRMEL